MMHARFAAIGVAFGFALSRTGFSSWERTHAMFTLRDLHLVFAFAMAVGLLAVGWLAVQAFSREKPEWAPRNIHRGTVLGSVLFGTGWAISGACPSVALVQLGEGQLGAAFTLAGIFVGNYAYATARERWLHWNTGSCVDD